MTTTTRFTLCLLLSTLLIATAACGGCGGAGASTNAPPPSAATGGSSKSLRFSLPSDGGDLVSIPLGNHTAVIDVWAPTCIPCKKALPELVSKSAEIEAAGGKLVLVAILTTDESTDAARAKLKEWGVSRPFLIDRGGVLLGEGYRTMPATLVVAPSGDVRWVAPEKASADDVVAAVRAAR